jgi:hypothetical protein
MNGPNYIDLKLEKKLNLVVKEEEEDLDLEKNLNLVEIDS